MNTTRRGLARLGTVITAGAMLAGSAVLATASVATGATSHGVSAAVVGHFTCYKIEVTTKDFPKNPHTAKLYDRWHPGGYNSKIYNAVNVCNPATKWIAVGGATNKFPSPNPRAHLVCFAVPLTRFQNKVTVFNQFTASKYVPLTIGTQQSLCLPSWKSLKVLPTTLPAAPPGLDHYTCYQAKSSIVTYNPFKLPSFVGETDEFNPTTPYSLQSIRLPLSLCVPTTKVVLVGTTSHKYAALNLLTDPALLCWTILQAPLKPVVYAKNQFGNGTPKVIVAQQFCVPSKLK
jgi:hypothetical protein